MANPGAVAGLNCHFYRNSATHASPTWVLVPIVRDLTLGLEKKKADASARGATWRTFVPILKSGSLEVKAIADATDANYDVFRDAFINDTLMDLAMADGLIATSGTEYFRADYYVFGFKRGEPLEDLATIDMTLDIAYSSNTPAFTTVGS